MLLAAGGQKTSLQLPSWYPDYEWQSDRVGILNVIVMGMNDLEDLSQALPEDHVLQEIRSRYWKPSLTTCGYMICPK